MKFLLVALLIVCVFARFDRFDGWSRERLRNYFGVHIDHTVYEDTTNYAPTGQAFDGRTQWPTCAWDIQDQGQCGSCWSFGLSESIADRWCIKNGAIVELSPQDAVSCDNTDYGCQGGYLANSMTYAQKTGIVSRDCFPYTSGNGKVPKCPGKCANSETWATSKHKITSYTQVTGGVNAIMNAIQQGPCDVAFEVYDDFFNYSTGVYVWDGTSPLDGGHAVKMLGFGTDPDSKMDYWICANSWGVSWAGLQGYFWIQKGVNMCQIESNVFCATI